MKRRSGAGATSKPRRRKAAVPKRASGTGAAARLRSSSAAGQETAVARLTHERDEALLREAANSEILGLISRSPGDLELVFRSILENATRICNAHFGTLFRFDGENFHPVAQFNTPAALLEAFTRRGPFKPTPGILLDHVMRTKQVAHSADSAAEPVAGLAQKLGGARSLVCVPMLKDWVLVGAITIYRQEVRPFTDKQIELVKNFAAQAVIAIENARLLNVLRQRTADLSESLEQQTATSEVLRVISSSPGDLQQVFEAMLQNAVRVCDAKFGTLFRFDDKAFHFVAEVGTPPALAEFQKKRGPFLPLPGSTLERAMQTHQVCHAADVVTEAIPSLAGRLGGGRSVVCVPMLKDDALIGAILIYRQEVRPFTDKQIELVKNFAAQAVIAIENARLLSELRESLQQQTASADVLRIISASPGELGPVFDSILANAIRLCEAKFGTLYLFGGNAFRWAAEVGAPRAYAEFLRERGSFPPIPGTVLDRVVEAKAVVQIADDRASTNPSAPARLADARSTVCVPMLNDDELIGAIVIYRQEVRAFSEKQISLVQNFAAQAVIAIENARLLNELRESLDRQTATSQVLEVISSSPGELEPVFKSILENATRICQANFGFLHLYENGKFQTGAARYNMPPAFADDLAKRGQLQPGPLHPLVRMAASKQLLHILNYAEDPAYKQHDPLAVRLVELASARTLVEVPMLKEGELIGAIAIYRQEVRPFTEKQIELVQNFAAQAVIAIENARLLSELRQRTEQIARLNQQLEQRVADQVGEIERMGRLRRFLPAQVADLIVASGSEKQLESHRREITALFCDLRGFTGFSESSDPEDVMALLAEYHAAIGTIINKYSGTLERYAGDGVMVIFNDPVPVENPALQAVLMALEMRAAIGGLIERWRDLGHDLGFGIGIAHGFATLGTIGFEGRRDYAAIGTVSNVASRLCDEAKPSQILISPRVRQAVEKAVTVESVGEFALKGIRRPMMTYNVVDASPTKLN